jgi:hypothetical protein
VDGEEQPPVGLAYAGKFLQKLVLARLVQVTEDRDGDDRLECVRGERNGRLDPGEPGVEVLDRRRPQPQPKSRTLEYSLNALGDARESATQKSAPWAANSD